MYEEIDLRPYFEAIAQAWKWLLIVTVVAIVLTFLAVSLLPQTYEATAVVAITEDREIVRFDPRFETIDALPPSRAYPELAMSDGMLRTLFEELDASLPGTQTLSQMRGHLTAASGSDPSLVRLTVNYRDPQLAAEIANTWAELFVGLANDLYGISTVEQLEFYQQQLLDAEEDLEVVEQALVDFQARNPASTLENRLTALQEEQSSYLSRHSQVGMLTQDVAMLRNRLADSENGNPTTADQIAALALQLKVFNAEMTSTLQLQLPPSGSLIGDSTEDQIAYLDTLLVALDEQKTQIDRTLLELEPEILRLQGEQEQAVIEQARLDRRRELADEAYRALARKVEEEQITSSRSSSAVRLASRAATPATPAGPRRLFLSAGAGGVGLVLTISLVLAITWWRQPPPP